MSLEQAILTHAAALTRLADALTNGRLATYAVDTADQPDQTAAVVEAVVPHPAAAKVGKPAPAPKKTIQEQLNPPLVHHEEPGAAVEITGGGVGLTYEDLKRPFVDIAKKHGVTAALARLAQFGNPKALHELEHKPDVWGQAFAALEE